MKRLLYLISRLRHRILREAGISTLQKDPQRRLHDIADARLLIDDDRSDAAPVPRSRLGWAVAAALVLLAVGVAVGTLWAPWRSPAAVAGPVRFEIAPNVSLAASGASAISPNGRHLAFIGSGTDGVLRVWVRDLDSLVDRPLPGSEVGQATPPPFWSPDSRFIAFDAGGKLKKVDVSGGLAQTVCDLPSAAVGGSWNRDGVIIFGNPGGGIMRVPEAGGTPSPITVVDPSRSENNHLTPVFLPDGRRFL